MRTVLYFGIVLAIVALGQVSASATDASDAAKTYGSAWSPALGAWLPNVDSGFLPWTHGQSAWTPRHDFFVCAGAQAVAMDENRFEYAGRGCPQLAKATAFAFGGGEPITGRVAYDRAHRIALYNQGCCAWRGYVLVANMAGPPKTVTQMDLSGVRTMRGIVLGMSEQQVRNIYGTVASHTEKNLAGATVLSYTTLKNKPSDTGIPCGQYQNFTFRNNRLVSIELLAGC